MSPDEVFQFDNRFAQLLIVFEHALGNAKTGLQFRQVAGLDEIVIRTRLEAFDDVQLAVSGANQNDVCTLITIQRANLGGELQAGHARHHPINNSQLRSRRRLKYGQGLRPIVHNLHLITEACKEAGDDLAADLVVVCDERFSLIGLWTAQTFAPIGQIGKHFTEELPVIVSEGEICSVSLILLLDRAIYNLSSGI